jgi:dephospho-CoA kinase
MVANPRKKPIIGIVGGIASGKSTVANEFEKLGCAIIRADVIAHELLQERVVREEIVGLFGPEVLNACGEIDRRKLAQKVFADARKLAALNKVLHPRVLERTEALLAEYQYCAHVKAIVLDMPLLMEVGWADRCDRLIFVKCDRRRRADRARQAGLLDEAEIRIRENFQISLDKKARRADNTIDNNSDFLTLVRQINEIFSDIARSS